MLSPEQNLSEQAIPGLDLEPIDPFVDDVFAGLDEHPSGLWPHHTAVGVDFEHHAHPNAHFPAIDCSSEGQQQLHPLLLHSGELGPQGHDATTEDEHSLAPSCMTETPAEDSAPLLTAPFGLTDSGHQALAVPETACGACQEDPLADAAPAASPPSTSGSSSDVPDIEDVLRLGPGSDDLAEQQHNSQEQQQQQCEDKQHDREQQLLQDQDRQQQQQHHQQQDQQQQLVQQEQQQQGQQQPDLEQQQPDLEEQQEHNAALFADSEVPQAWPSEHKQESPLQQSGMNASMLSTSGGQHGLHCGSSGGIPSRISTNELQGQSVHSSTECGQLASSTSSAATGSDTEAAGRVAADEGPLEAPAWQAAHKAAAAENAAGAETSGFEAGDVAVTPAAAAPGVDDAATTDTEQQLSVGAEEFASPCSSWHSCITSASRASSLAASKGFFGPGALHPAAAAAADSVQQQQHRQQHQHEGSQQMAWTHTEGTEPQQQLRASQQAQADSRGSLHMALQQLQWQQQEDSCGTQAAAAVCEGHTGVTCLAERSDPLAAGKASHPIAVRQPQQQQQQQDDDVWQSVSPPSLGCSPPAFGVPPPPPPAAAATAAAVDQQHGTDAAASGDEDDDVGHAHFYVVGDAAGPAAAMGSAAASASASGMMPQHMEHLLRQHHMLLPHQLSASSYMLRQSELVDLSLSTSIHTGPQQLQQQQQYRPAWLTAHQQLPPAAAQAVERAVVALNDSYYYHGRASPSDILMMGAAAAGAPGPGASRAAGGGNAGLGVGSASHASNSGGARGGGIGGFSLVGRGIRRSGSGLRQWSKAQTQPQQDQQARHILHNNHQSSQAGAGVPFGWPGATVLGDWFSSTVQQPLAAAASRAAAGMGQRLGMAAGGPQHQNQNQQLLSQQGNPGRYASSASVRAASGAAGHGSHAGSTPSSSHSLCAVDPVPSNAGSAAPVAGVAADSCSEEDGVLVEKTPDLPQSLQEQEDEAFRGLLFLGGRDSHGRPVVIVNTDAIPAGHNPAPRDAALAYLLKRLGPLVTRGPYVLVIVALHNGPQFRLLPGVWCVRAYQSLPRAFHKNVKHVVLLQPSLLVKAAVTLLWPFVSSKAHTKVKQVQRLLDIDAATSGEVQVPHLGEAFLTTLHHINSSRANEADTSSRSAQG